MKTKIVLFILVIFFCAGAGEGMATEIMDNETVVKLSQAGLNDSIIIKKIKISTPRFDLSTDALIKLKGRGVSDGVIEAILKAQDASPGERGGSPPTSIPRGRKIDPVASGGISESGAGLRAPLRRLNGCEARLAQFMEENPEFNKETRRGEARVGSFQLSAERKIQVFGSLLERSAKCFSLKRRGRIERYSDKTLISFDGSTFVFHDFYLVGNNAAFGAVENRNLGDSRTPHIRGARVSTQVADPAATEIIVIKK